MSDLTDRMRTCASYIMANNNPADVHRDAATLLVEAADKLDGLVVPLPQGEPMAIIPPVEPVPPIPEDAPSVWVGIGGPLPGLKHSGTTSMRACPRCDSRGYKRVYRISCTMMIACQVCGHSWEFGR